jgi:hypothetical protein
LFSRLTAFVNPAYSCPPDTGELKRRLLRELATSGDVQGDITTFEDFAVISKLKNSEE